MIKNGLQRDEKLLNRTNHQGNINKNFTPHSMANGGNSAICNNINEAQEFYVK